jgi:hypothetical protein
MHPFVAVLHRYVVEFLAAHNTDVCAQIMEPDYVLHMGDVTLGPRDDVYVPAVAAQLQQFPGLCMNVHDLFVNTDGRLAMHFSQHGASRQHGGRQAVWQGVGLYRWNGTRLTSNVALEDYEGRRIQLSTGISDSVKPIAVAPWDEVEQEPNDEAEHVVREWLASKRWTSHTDGGGVVLADATVTVTEIVSGGLRVGFAGVARGQYAGGLDVPDSCVGANSELHLVGYVTVSHPVDDSLAPTVSGVVVTGRGPLRRQLLAATGGR